MIQLSRLTAYLNEYLNIKEMLDESWNGLQIQGKDEVTKIITGVTAGKDLFEKAIDEKADFIIVHHGQFWKRGNPSFAGWNKERMQLLTDNNISLYGVHLPLDAHKEVGNNAQLLKLIGADITKEFGTHHESAISWMGEFKKPTTVEEVEKTLNEKLPTECKTLPFGKKEIKTVAVCSGGGGYDTFFEALNENVDLYITGDSVEIYNNAKDAGMHVIFAGHHATERIGVQTLQKKLEEKFEVETQFIDIPTEL